MSRLVGLLLLGMALGALANWAFQSSYRPPPRREHLDSASDHSPSATHQSPPAKQAVHALGTLEPQGGSVLVTSPLVGTPIKEVLVREGQLVTAGQHLVQLDPTVLEEELRLAQTQRQQVQERQENEIALARQRVEAASLALEQAQSARGAELGAQNKQLELAQTKLIQAQDDLKRLEQVGGGQRPLVSAQQIEHQKTLVKLASVEHDAGKTSLDRLEQTLKFNLQKARTEKKAAEEALAIASRGTAMASLDQQIKLAEHKLAQALVTAPSEGTVISLLAHPGELVSTQPLVQLANLNFLECHAEVDIADLPLIKNKHEAVITCRAFRGNKLKATIDRVRSVSGAATLRPVDPRKPVDRTVATVVLKLDGHEAAKLLGASLPDSASALMGLQVDVEIPL